ncbi:DUF2730 family protein [Devosia sediminis]|uniref:DUF2730 family protein n=1 Tax=Devosia sediminis TaxID=2798801 RepID=A0A934IMC7_9HYPH|nr:DUF2730 family protein [Devosia sediminis]MBJ3783399.1 DUF2730 family protein [Devosia sediminis]
MEFLKDWLGLGVSLLAFGTAAWGVLQGPARKNEKALEDFKAGMTAALETFKTATADQIKALDDRLDSAETRITQLDTVIDNLPDKDAFHQLDKGLTEVRGKIDTISVVVDSADEALKRIEGFLINAAQSASRGH